MRALFQLHLAREATCLVRLIVCVFVIDSSAGDTEEHSSRLDKHQAGNTCLLLLLSLPKRARQDLATYEIGHARPATSKKCREREHDHGCRWCLASRCGRLPHGGVLLLLLLSL